MHYLPNRNLVDEKTAKTTCKECGEEHYVTRRCCSEPTSNKRFPVNIYKQHTVCSDCSSDMVRLPCCRQLRPSLKLDNSIYDCVNCSKYSVECTCTNINCLLPKGSSWKCKNFTCGQVTVHCGGGRLTYQDLKSKYNCICGYEFEYDIETGIATYGFMFVICLFNFLFTMSCVIASFNVNGLRQTLKRKTIFHYLKQEHYDMILLQETHSTSSDEKQWECKWGGHILFAHGESHIKGVAILFTKNLKVEFGSKYSNSDGRVLLLYNIQIKDKKISLVLIYAPTKNEPKIFDNLFSILSNFSKHDVVLAGDWNLVLYDQLDKDGGPVHTNSASKECLKSYINEFNLIDIYRELNPSRKTYTRTQSQPYTSTRLNFFNWNKFTSSHQND